MIDFSLVYDRRKEVKKNVLGLIEIRAYLRGSGDHRHYTTKIRVNPLEWNEKEKKIANKNKDADLYNRILLKHIKDLSDLQYEREYKKLPFTFEDVKAHFKYTDGKIYS